MSKDIYKNTRFYYSNCFFEAVKAKLKNWKNTKIIFKPASLNGDGFHFMWKNLITGDYYDFSYRRNDRRYCKLLFKGHLRCFSEKTYNRIFNEELSRYTKKLGEKVGFIPYQNLYEGVNIWKDPNEYLNLNESKNYEKILYSIFENGEFTLKVKDISSLSLEKAYTDDDLLDIEKEGKGLSNGLENEMRILDFVGKENITGWRYLNEKIPTERF